jgi:hypothetical protein
MHNGMQDVRMTCNTSEEIRITIINIINIINRIRHPDDSEFRTIPNRFDF